MPRSIACHSPPDNTSGSGSSRHGRLTIVTTIVEEIARPLGLDEPVTLAETSHEVGRAEA